MKPCCDRIHYPTCFRFISALAALALSASLSAQQRGPRGSVVDNQIDAIPASMQKNITVMVELNAAPAAKSYSAALKVAQDQADAARNYALAHPSLKSSKTLLAKKPQPVQISAAAATQIASEVKQLDQAQRTLATQLTGANIGGKILFRAQRSYNGIVLAVAPNKIADIANLPGVKAVHPMHPKFLTTAFSDIDFLGTRAFWSKAPFGVHGENIKVADIDTGLDYIHTDFGGPGPSGYTGISDKSPVPNPYFPTQKVPGGFDFAGDNYNANQPPGTGHDPSPDPNPFDCNGHGTATASLIAGYGVTNAGFTYAGSYDAANPAISSLSIAPGHAPNAKLFPLRVFGCTGSTNLVVEAIEWAIDPNGDGNFSDHMDVINMSLGSNEGYADDADDIAASNAAAIGILVCSAAGNAGDSYYIHSSPAAASGTLSVGATFNDQNGFIFDASVTGNSPNLTGVKYPAIYASTSPHTSVTGDVVYARPATADVPLTNAAQVAGHIVLIDRGVATFATKAANAQAAGAIGIIVANTTGDPIVQGATGTVTVPDVMISTADGAALKAAAAFNSLNGVPANPTNVTIAPDN